MKRIEMVKLMTLAYQESHQGGNSEMTDEERMSYILTKMQEAGMELIVDINNTGYNFQIGFTDGM